MMINDYDINIHHQMFSPTNPLIWIIRFQNNFKNWKSMMFNCLCRKRQIQKSSCFFKKNTTCHCSRAKLMNQTYSFSTQELPFFLELWSQSILTMYQLVLQPGHWFIMLSYILMITNSRNMILVMKMKILSIMDNQLLQVMIWIMSKGYINFTIKWPIIFRGLYSIFLP